MPKTVYVYILASRPRGTLYIGVTSNLARRMHQHREHLLEGFTSKYGVTRLVWYVHGDDISAAIALEKKIKNRGRQWKVDLIEMGNPDWDDLAAAWMDPGSWILRPRAGRPSGGTMNRQPDKENVRMSKPLLRPADPVADRQALIDLNVAHVSWVFSEVEKTHGIGAREILGMAVEDYVPTIIDKVCGDSPPRGVFYLVEDHAGRALAMGGLRWSEDGVAELKRVYVRPEGRGQGLGALIVARLLADARAFGYRTIRLDTMPFMKSAIALYEGLGFVDCAPYPIEMPPVFRAGIRFMELTL